MDTLKIMDLKKVDADTGDAKVLSDLIGAFAARESVDKSEDYDKKVIDVLTRFIAFCSVLPQASDLVPNTMKISPTDDGTTDEKE